MDLITFGEYNVRTRSNEKTTPPSFTFLRLRCSFGALWHSLRLAHRPKSTSLASSLWFLTWIPRLALGLVIGILGATVEAALLLAGAMVISLVTVALVVLAIVNFMVFAPTLLILHLPLYLLDLTRAIGRFCCGEKDKKMPNPQPERSNTPSSAVQQQTPNMGTSYSSQGHMIPQSRTYTDGFNADAMD